VVAKSNDAIPLPDIKEAKRKKQMEEELARMEDEKEEKRVRIKRSDKEAFTKVRIVWTIVCVVRELRRSQITSKLRSTAFRATAIC